MSINTYKSLIQKNKGLFRNNNSKNDNQNDEVIEYLQLGSCAAQINTA